MRVGRLCAVLVPLAVAFGESFQGAVQGLINDLSQQHGYAIQFAWQSSSETFSLAAGSQLGTAVPITAKDTFAWGSGTKPYTAALLLYLVEQRMLSLKDTVSRWVDPIFTVANKTTLVGLFGSQACNVTVGHLLRMQSGLNDFDVPKFDEAVLRAGKVNGPMDFLYAAARQHPTFVCQPGSCTSYSSTNYVLAGYVALAVGHSASWTLLDQKAMLPVGIKGQFANSAFMNAGPLDTSMTVAGMSGNASGTAIFKQDASLWGWTCGNLVAPAGDAARFFYDLLVGGNIISPESVKEMQDFRPLDVGWAKGFIQYGAGLMVQQTSWNATYPPVLHSWGSYIGHGGETYGFLSEAGLLTQFQATFAAAVNQDYDGSFVKNVLVCKVIELAAQVLLKQNVYLKCGGYPSPVRNAANMVV